MTMQADRGQCPACGWRGAMKRDGAPFRHWAEGTSRAAGDEPCPGAAPAGTEQQ